MWNSEGERSGWGSLVWGKGVPAFIAVKKFLVLQSCSLINVLSDNSLTVNTGICLGVRRPVLIVLNTCDLG